MTHTITREMLVATLNDVMTERDAAERLRDQYRDDYSKTLTSNTKLRAQVETLESNAKLALEQLDAERGLRKQVCTCALGPIQTRSPDENTRIRELVTMVNSKDEELLQLSMQCDALKREIALLTVKFTPPFQLNAATAEARIKELTEEVKKWHGDSVNANYRISQLLDERDSLKQKQCDWNQLQTALAARDQALSQLPETMQHCTIKYLECEFGHGRLHATNWVDHGCHHCKLDKLETELKAAYGGDGAPYIVARARINLAITILVEGLYSNMMLMSNPPKNMVAYRVLQILRGLP